MITIYCTPTVESGIVSRTDPLKQQFLIMCQSYPKDGSSAGSNAESAPRIYPSLAQMLASMATGNQESPQQGDEHLNPSNQAGGPEILMRFLNRMFQEFTTSNMESDHNRHPYQEPHHQTGPPYPGTSNDSAPPFAPSSPQSPWTRPREDSGSSPGGWWHPNSETQRPPHDPTTETCRVFAASIKSSLRRLFLMIFLAIFVFLVPRMVLVYGIFISGIFAMGWPLKPFLVTGMAIHTLLWISPCFLELLAVYALFKMFMLKKPLLNRRYWHAFFSLEAPRSH